VSRSLNKATIMGHLGADPEIRTTANGGKVATLSLATSKQWKNQSGEKQEKTEWHRVVLWDNAKGARLASLAESYLTKGSKLYVEGQIEYRTWDDKDGQKRYTTEIVGREVILLSGDNKQLAAAYAPKGADADFSRMPDAITQGDAAEGDDLSW
jgi:single-strand DNA-binding protein